MRFSSHEWRSLSCFAITMLGLFALGFPQLAGATYQLPEKAVSALDALTKLKITAESRAIQIAGGLKSGFHDENVIQDFRDCRMKYENASGAYSAMIDQMSFLSRQGQELSPAAISQMEKYAIERRRAFWNCKFVGRTDVAASKSINVDGESLRDIFKLLLGELQKIKEDLQRRNILKAYAKRLEEQKWRTWEEIEEDAGKVVG